MLLICFPILVLMLACLGVGSALLYPARRYFSELPPWVVGVIAYFLGQGILASWFLLLAAGNTFTSPIVITTVSIGAFLALPLLWQSARVWRVYPRHLRDSWRDLPIEWRTLAGGVVLLIGFGFTSLGGWVQGDAIAFYLVVSKLVCETGGIEPVPSYESFSTVGLLAEVLIAGLMCLGTPELSTRIFSWFNFLPMSVAFYGLAAQCGLGIRGRILTLTVVATSSAVLVLWGTGKTDLFAVGPAIASTILALASWNERHKLLSITLSGMLCGFAVIFKLSYAVPLVPAVALIVSWPILFQTWEDIRRAPRQAFLHLVSCGALSGAVFVCGFLFAVAPHILKNIYVNGSAFGSFSLDSAWFASKTVRRLILTYPFALTYGNYWAQFGNLSPLVLAFLPLLLVSRQPTRWVNSKVAAVGVASCAGMFCWLVAMPSIFMPRYFLATVIMLSIPAAAAAESFSLRNRWLGVLVVAAALVSTALAPINANASFPTFQPGNVLQHLLDPDEPSSVGPLMARYADMHKAVNQRAGVNDRVYLWTHYRYWLRSDLLRKANTDDENKVGRSVDVFWDLIRKKGFSFVMIDGVFLPAGKDAIEKVPADLGLKELYNDGELAAYEVVRSQ